MDNIDDIAYLLRAISNSTRLKVISVLKAGGEMNVSELVQQIGCEQSLLSHHLTDMRAKGVLNCRKCGKMCFYSLKNRQVSKILDCINGNCSD